MGILPNTLRLYAVSDRSWLKDGEHLRDILPLLFENGVTLFQLREKSLAREAFVEEALESKEICRRYHIPLIINDAVDIAKEIGADGVHVGLSDMDIKKAREILGSYAIIGASAHNTAEALAAEKAGADYIGCGAVFSTATKTDVTPLLHSELTAICRAVHIPVVAIGGITEKNLPKLNGSGIAGAAVISALFAQENIGAATRHLRALADML
ncbi:MAG: thiamine phosphate synthase [Lachnospiraceae bacterium]|nr:thiamine phosphate synthase [Lachnospiraceae bacterium]